MLPSTWSFSVGVAWFIPTFASFLTQNNSPPAPSIVTLGVPPESVLILCWNPAVFQFVVAPVQPLVPTVKYGLFWLLAYVTFWTNIPPVSVPSSVYTFNFANGSLVLIPTKPLFLKRTLSLTFDTLLLSVALST